MILVSATPCFGQFGVAIGFDGNSPATDGYGTLLKPPPVPERVLPEDLAADRWAVEDFKREQKSILDELDANAGKLSAWEKAWAGVYRSSDEQAGSSTTFTIGMGGRYVAITEFESSRCRTEWSGHGIAEVGEDGFVLDSDEGVLPKCLYGAPTPQLSYTFFKWGDDRLFVPDGRMVRFVNRYNSWREDWSAVPGLFRRVRSEAGAAAGRPVGNPQLPVPYAAMLLDRPVRLVLREILSVTYNHHIEGVVRCSGGSRGGVYEGMEIEYREGDASGTIRVLEVGADSCIVEVKAIEMPAGGYPAVGHTFEFGPMAEGPKGERTEGEDGG